jgi:hypothetical protein
MDLGHKSQAKERPMHVHLELILKPNQMSVMYPLLQQGFEVTARVGCDMQSLLCDQFGLMPAYLADRINTIFLDGRPVDDAASAVVNDGATVALSAAMPGLVGATFRKAGCLAAFRGSITYRQAGDPADACREGTVTLKLFNLLVSEIGHLFLKRGIWIADRPLKRWLESHRSNLESIVAAAKKDGADMPLAQMADPAWITAGTRYLVQATSVS